MKTHRIFIFIALLSAACSKNNTGPAPQHGQSTLVTDLPGDTSASMTGGNGSNFKNLYFSFSTNTAVVISGDNRKSLAWDLAFTGPYNSEVYVNSGGYSYNPGYGGPGKGAIIQIDKPYDQVTSAPSNEEFDASTVSKIGWDAGNGTGWFFYSLTNHIAVPIKNRTFVLRTAGGRFAKLELLNIYKGNPPVVTDLFWPAPYLTFRYSFL